MCGEQQYPVQVLFQPGGSPPRVRGTGEAVLGKRRGHRITPACAGNSSPRIAHNHRCKDHPRVCGEQMKDGEEIPGAEGSPPRVRGTASKLFLFDVSTGITPACAGNSCGFHSNFANAQDHPRVCGEQIAFHTSAAGISGSPPRVRGTVMPV